MQPDQQAKRQLDDLSIVAEPRCPSGGRQQCFVDLDAGHPSYP